MKHIWVAFCFTAALSAFLAVSAVEAPMAGWAARDSASPSDAWSFDETENADDGAGGGAEGGSEDGSEDSAEDVDLDVDLLPDDAPVSALPIRSNLGKTMAKGLATPGSATVAVDRVLSAGMPGTMLLTDLSGAASYLQDILAHDEYSTAVVKLETGARGFFSIEYDLTVLDTASAGMMTIHGTIMPPEGYTISPDMADVEVPVFLCDPEHPQELPVASCDLPFSSPVLLSQSAGADDLLYNSGLDLEAWPVLENGLSFQCALAWDFSGISFGTPGDYTAVARLDLPAGALLRNEIQFQCPVQVQKDGAFTLGPPDFRGVYFTVDWLKETPDISLFRRYYAIGDGEWQEDTDGDLIEISRYDTQYIRVFYYENVTFDTPYYFRLSYDGEFSNTLEVYLSEDRLKYRFYDGDRDGGDREEQEKPDVSQPEQTKPGETEPGETQPEQTQPEETKPEQTEPGETGSEGSSPGGDGQEQTQPDGSNDSNTANDDGTSDNDSTDDDSTDGNSTDGNSKNSGTVSHPGVTGPSSGVILAPSHETSGGPGAGTDMTGAAGLQPTPPADSRPTPPADSRPAPPVDNQPASSAQDGTTADSDRMEADADGYVILSGRRISILLEDTPGWPLTFEKQQIRLEIPSDSEFLVHMADDSLLRADLVPQGASSVFVQLSVDGVPVSSAPELTITMPWPSSDADTKFEVRDRHGDVVGTAAYTDGSVRFTVRGTGLFTVLGRSADASAGVAPEEASGLAAGVAPEGASGQAAGVAADAAGVFLSCIALLAGAAFFRKHRGKGTKEGGGRL